VIRSCGPTSYRQSLNPKRTARDCPVETPAAPDVETASELNYGPQAQDPIGNAKTAKVTVR
jgi:hypothetical protein